MGKFKYLFLFLYLIVLAAGLTSEPCMGDEIYHYRFAKNFYWQNSRPIVDVVYRNYPKERVVFYYDMFWHFCLSRLWKLAGAISLVTAQIYHSLFYLFLLIATFLLAKELYDEETALYAAFIVATVPMVGVFSTFFYIDVPGTMLSVLCVLLLVKKRYFWSGVALGLMYLTKRNVLLFAPALVFIGLYDPARNLRVKVKCLAVMFLVSALLIVPDVLWREKNFKQFPRNIFTSTSVIMSRFSGMAKEPAAMVVGRARKLNHDLTAADRAIRQGMASLVEHWQRERTIKLHVSKAMPSSYAPSEGKAGPEGVKKAPGRPAMQVELGDVKTFSTMLKKDFKFAGYLQNLIFLSYFGFTLFLALLLYFVWRVFKRKDIVIWSLIGTYALFYGYFLSCSNEVRYLLPIIPFVSIIAAIPIAAARNRWFKACIIALSIAQVALACSYVSSKRRVPREINDGFAYLKNRTAPDSTVFYVEYILLDKTERRLLLPHAADPRLITMFWSQDPNEVLRAMNELDMDYLAIKKSRIYEDTDRYYFSGYPRSFVQRLSTFSFANCVFDNAQISIWKIARKGTP